MPFTRKKSFVRQLTLLNQQERTALFGCSRTVVRHDALQIKSAPAQLSHGRILIVVPRKVGSAPERNKIKRRVRSIFYEMKLYKYQKDLLIFAKIGAPEIAFKTLANEIEKAATQ